MPLFSTPAIEQMAVLISNRFQGSPGTNNVLKIYKGTIPGSATGYDPASYTSDELISLSPWTLTTLNESVIFNIFPDNTTLIAASGTATWYAMQYTVTQPTYVIIGEVSDGGGDGTIKLTTTALVATNQIGNVTFNLQLLEA